MKAAAVRATAHLEVECDGGRTRVSRVRSEPPLVLRDSAPHRFHLVAVGAGPLGGDELTLRVRVGDGARLRVTQVASAVALPGPAPVAASRVRYEVELGAHAWLLWEGEPTIAAAGAVHISELRVRAASTSWLCWRDEIVCGRAGEPSGLVHTSVTVVRGGETQLRADTTIGDERWTSPAVGGGARVIGSLLLLGRAAASGGNQVCDGFAVLRPRDGLAVVTALANDHPTVRTGLTRVSARASDASATSA